MAYNTIYYSEPLHCFPYVSNEYQNEQWKNNLNKQRNTMSNLRIIELEQQLKRRDERLNEIEAKISKLQYYMADIKYDGVSDENTPVMLKDNRGDFFKSGDVWNCFK